MVSVVMPCDGLPVELEQHILSYLKDDIPTLKTCSLTCRRWVYSTQRFLFARIVLDFRHVLFPSQANPPDRFCQLLLSSPRISAYVKELSIIFSHGTEDQDLHRLTDILQVCLPLLRHLRGINLGRAAIPGIRKIYIWPVSWHFIPSVVRNELSTTFRSQSLVNIRLAHMRGIPLSVLALSGCPRLEGLFLEDITFGGVLDTANQAAEWALRPSKDLVLQCQRRSLKTLRLVLSEHALQTFAQWATSPECPLDISNLEHLSVTMIKQYADHEFINALLDECADSLQTFCCRIEIQGKLHFQYRTKCQRDNRAILPFTAIGVGLDAVTYPLDISRLHNLRTLRLVVSRPKKTIFHNYRMYIPNILTQLNEAHQHLEEISVKCDVSEWKDASTVCDIAERVREHLLVPGRFVSLRRLVWLVSGSSCLRAALAAGMAGLEKKGISCVQVDTACDGGFAGYLDGEEDIFEIV